MGCIVHGVTKSQTPLSDFTFSFPFFAPSSLEQLDFWFFCILLSIVWASLVAQIIKNLPAVSDTQV